MDSTLRPTVHSERELEQLQSFEDLISEGEYKLLQNQFSEAIELFAEAEELMGNSRPDLYYREGLALFEYGCDEGKYQALLLANKKFKKAHANEPYCGDILQAWGNSLTQLGELQEEHHYFLSALEKYEQALGLGIDTTEIFWDYGAIWYWLGRQSGEAIDLQKGLQAFERAKESQEIFPPEFWIDYGATALLLFTKIRDGKLIKNAVDCFKEAVSLDSSQFVSWSSLAEALQLLYEFTHDEEHFSRANECFKTASQLEPQDAEHWLDWAKFLIESAHQNRDSWRMREGLEKCRHAYIIDPQNPSTLGVWAEGLALLGEITERLDLIYEAENKIAEALEFDEEDPELWYRLGRCFQSFGRYFSDIDYYYQAIERFQTGLSIDRTFTPLWHEIANTYSTIGKIEESTEPLVQSIKFYEKAVRLAPSSTLHIDFATTYAKLGEVLHDQKWLQQALIHFEFALNLQKNAVYIHPDWLFSYAGTLDLLGDFHEDETYYNRAIEIFSHVLMVDPEFPGIHHRISQAFCHLGELLGENDYFYRAIHHLRLALKQDEENDSMILDWGIALINIAQHSPILTDTRQLMMEAKQKLTTAAKLGNVQGYYFLACLYSLLEETDCAMAFLQKADVYQALPPLEELLNDDWLENLRGTSAFVEFLSEHPHLQ